MNVMSRRIFWTILINFPAAEARRRHLINKLNDRHEYFTTIEKLRAPFSLVVTKYKKSMDEKHRKWKARVGELKRHLISLDGRLHTIRERLEDKYNDIMAVRVHNLIGQAGQAVEESSAKSDNARSSPLQVKGQKRKAAAVDLTDD